MPPVRTDFGSDAGGRGSRYLVDGESPSEQDWTCGHVSSLRRDSAVCMGVMDSVVRRVAAGEPVEFRPVGSSMVPLIKSRQLVTVVPVRPELVEPGDIVLARVAGSVYLHLVSAVDHERRRVQIGNNRGRVNGWTSHARVYGICTSVDAVARQRVAGKIRNADDDATSPTSMLTEPGEGGQE
jgi:hypothetical protein